MRSIEIVVSTKSSFRDFGLIGAFVHFTRSAVDAFMNALSNYNYAPEFSGFVVVLRFARP